MQSWKGECVIWVNSNGEIYCKKRIGENYLAVVW